MNPKSEIQEVQDTIHKAHLHLKQINSNSPETEACHYAIEELQKAQQKLQAVQQQINE